MPMMTVFVLLATVAVAVPVLIVLVTHNRLVALDQRCGTAFSDIDVHLKHRQNLIPGLVEVVRGFAGHEHDVLLGLGRARAETLAAHSPDAKLAAGMARWGDCGDAATREVRVRRHHVDVPLATLLKAVGWTPSDSSIGLDGRHIEETPEGEADEDLSRRCFRTAIYEPGDWGLHGVDDASEPGGDFDIRGWLARAEKVAAAAAGAGDQPLRDYVVARKTCYETIHHLFGERGVAFARRSFASPAHQGAVRRLRERLGDPRWAASLPTVERAEAPLLAAAPDDFVSCVARDGVAGRRG